MASTSKRYPAELKDRAVRMAAEIRSEHGSEWAAVESVAEKLGIGTAQTVQNWVRSAEVDAASGPGCPARRRRRCGSYARRTES